MQQSQKLEKHHQGEKISSQNNQRLNAVQMELSS